MRSHAAQHENTEDTRKTAPELLADVIGEQCRSAGVHLNVPRRAILVSLCQGTAPRDAQHIRELIQVGDQSVSLGLIYRFLAKLEGIGLVERVDQGHRKSLFCLKQDAPTLSLRLQGTDKMISINDEAIEMCLRDFASARGLSIVTKQIVLVVDDSHNQRRAQPQSRNRVAPRRRPRQSVAT